MKIRVILATLAASVALLIAVKPVEGCGYGMPSPTARFALADCVLVGKVVNIEEKKLRLRLNAKGEPLPFTVAVLKVQSMILGDERLTHVRVALHQHQVMPIGFEACCFLAIHPEEPVYLLSSNDFDYPIGKENNPGFNQQVEQFRRMGKLLRDPIAGLESKNAEDRFLTTALLLTRFRTFRQDAHVAPDKTEPIHPQLNRLILKALAESDWQRNAADFRLTGQRLFALIGASAADGWKEEGNRTTQQRNEAARSWLKENEDKFRIKTFVRK